ncbi:hypothetical protein JJL45_07075 [Tamlana sp. s12]|uniref:hypothetical protein n=1 Tax=Tamlana sp. s12 TaxID=1630406 RepID=UPI0007FFC002|nr:hypothetical protein [Tamlana sp. s12]OBQ55580.1 hypothetical protein VQ01_09070 [Tamlana sp. s12]QQY83744.1 hypothetical protein JJL45_07075 [Tamlana sp. s12]
MKLLKLALLLPFLCCNFAKAQSCCVVKSENPQFENNWSFGIGLNIVDDSGNAINHLFDIKENRRYNWAFENPITLSVEYYWHSNISFFSTTSFNQFKSGKSIDGTVVGPENQPNFFAVDIGSKYSFRKFIKSKVFDFYAGASLGYTTIGDYTNDVTGLPVDPKNRFTINPTAGLNIWMTKNIALNMSGSAKFTYTPDTSHYLQYNLGLVYLLSKRD